MNTYVRPALGLGCLMLLAPGCADEADEFAEQAADAICTIRFECNDSTTYTDHESCVEAEIAEWEADTVVARLHDYEYDSACTEAEITRLEQLATCPESTDLIGPDGPSDNSSSSCVAPCKMWYGDAGLDQTCKTNAECIQGLYCGVTVSSVGPTESVCANPCSSGSF